MNVTGGRKRVAISHLTAAVTAFAALVSGCAGPSAQGPGDGDLAFTGSLAPGPPLCPATRDPGWQVPTATRVGDALLPPAPVVALLCVYPLTAIGGVADLIRTYTEEAAAGSLVSYLNGLSGPQGKEDCLAIGADTFTAVIGYADGHAVVNFGCGLESMGAVRRGYDIRKLFGYWGAPSPN